MIFGYVVFVDDYIIRVDEVLGVSVCYSVDYIILVMGMVLSWLEEFVFDDCIIFDSDGILKLKYLFCMLMVVGVGVIGVEYVMIFSVLNIKVILVDGCNVILDFLDEDIIDYFKYELIYYGISL